MADQTWPWERCKVVVTDYGLNDANNVRRTPMQDGAIDQRQLQEQVFVNRTFDVLVKESDLVAFRTWEKAHAKNWFNFTDLEDGQVRDRRVVGGRINLVRQDPSVDKLDGETYWRGTVELEGY